MRYRPRFEVVERASDMPRPGRLALTVDGVDADVTIDPAQWMPLYLLETKGDAVKAMELCVERATAALERRADRLMMGRPAGHGIVEVGAKPRSAQEAVEQYVGRGRWGKGQTPDERYAAMRKRAEKFDNAADWAARRSRLIEECKAELATWESRATAGDFKAPRMVAALKNKLAGLQPRVVAVIHGFQFAYTQYWTAAINLSTDDIRLWPYMTDTTIDSLRDAVDTFSDVTLDEFDGSGYTTGGLPLDGQTVAVDDANDRAEFDCSDEVVPTLAAGTRDMQGVAVGKFNTNTAASLPLHVIDFATNKTPDGSDFTFAINAEGLMQMADG